MKTTFSTYGVPTLLLNYGKQTLPTPDIQYIEGEGNYSLIRTYSNGQLLSSFTLRLFTDHLAEFQNFFSPRKGLLLNTDYLVEVNNKEGVLYAKMKDGKSHLLSRRKGKAFIAYLYSHKLEYLIQNQ